MKQYIDLLKKLVELPEIRLERTGTGTRSIFMETFRMDLQEGFPLLTTKKLHTKSIIHELLWFLKGSNDISYLKENGVTIWDEWADENGILGPVYGVQWRRWLKQDGESVDQISNLIDTIKNNPTSRRMLVSAWNPAEIENMALPPCHYAFQCYVKNGKLSLAFHMRSVDVFLGLPFNIASYALLVHMLAHQTNLDVGELVWIGGDVHLYANHYEQALEQIQREPYQLPSLNILRKPDSIFEYVFEDFEINNYVSHPHIKAEVSV